MAQQGADFAHLTVDGIQDSDFDTHQSGSDDDDDDEKRVKDSEQSKTDAPISYEELTTMRQETLLKLE